MNRRKFLRVSSGAVLAGRESRATVSSSRPNILIVFTDQQSSDVLSCRIGNRYLKTPNLDSLAANGMLFRRAYCANPICAPSRTSVFTGRYPAETGIEINAPNGRFAAAFAKRANPSETPFTLDPRKYPCLGSIFQRAGYQTAYFGKWHLPYPESNSDTHGFSIVNPKPKMSDADVASHVVEFLGTKPRAPFLLVTSFLNPHNICEWARGEKLSEGPIGDPPPIEQCPPRRSNYGMPKNETDAMIEMRSSYQATETFPVGNFDEKKWREYVWAYYRMVEKVDAEIGKVLGALRGAGLEEQTLVVFTADHGDAQGAHGWNQKTVFYDETAMVPLILSYKGVTRPGVSSRLVHTGVDVMPTLCAYAGIEAARGIPGMSLQDTANGSSSGDPREYLVVSNKMSQGAEIGGRLPVPEGRMVRSQRYKYCVYSEGRRRESLVDMEKDPGEMVNLAGQPQYQKILDRHRSMLLAWSRQIGDRFPAIPPKTPVPALP
jgi:arylsulfatase A-like enzyme